MVDGGRSVGWFQGLEFMRITDLRLEMSLVVLNSIFLIKIAEVRVPELIQFHS